MQRMPAVKLAAVDQQTQFETNGCCLRIYILRQHFFQSYVYRRWSMGYERRIIRARLVFGSKMADGKMEVYGIRFEKPRLIGSLQFFRSAMGFFHLEIFRCKNSFLD